MNCPCIDCLILPACKYKSFEDAVDCDLLYIFIFKGNQSLFSQKFNERMAVVLKLYKRPSLFINPIF